MALLAAGSLTLGVLATPATAEPTFPSAREVARSRSAAASTAASVGQIEARLAAASARSGQLATEVAQAVEAYNGARFRLEQAVQAGVVAQRKAQEAQGEVDAARGIQMGLLPDPRETLGNDRRFKLAALLEPARTVGGDFYDCFMLDDRRVFFLVADVSGKGLPASLFMASVKSQIKSAALSVQGSVGGILAHAQDDIARENPESLFVTAFAAVLDAETGELELANAGHEPAYARVPRGTAERLDAPGGPPLCVMEMYSYPTSKRKLVKGEWLCVITDGATEAQNAAREFFGSERLRTSLGWVGEDAHPHEIVRRVRDDVHRFAGDAEPADDLTLLAIRWNGRPETAAS